MAAVNVEPEAVLGSLLTGWNYSVFEAGSCLVALVLTGSVKKKYIVIIYILL